MYGSTSSTNSNSENPFENFSPTEFISLSENIATNIVYVKSSWQQLEKAIKIIGSPRDNNGARENFHNVQTITNEKIVSTSKDLQRLTVVVKRGDKQQKLQVERLTSDFKKIVEKYSDSQQLIAAKMKQIILINASQFDDDNNPTNISDSSNRTNEQLIQRQIQQNLEFDNEIMIEREQSVRKIEADILNVNDIMKGLNLLINQQGEVIGMFSIYHP